VLADLDLHVILDNASTRKTPAVQRWLQGRHRARRDGIGGSGAGQVEEDEPPERCHRLDPTLDVRQLRKDLTVCEPVRDEHDVARAFT
jgi:hypothetical protein